MKTAAVALVKPSRTDDVLERLLDAPADSVNKDQQQHGLLCTGTIAGVEPSGHVVIGMAGCARPLRARALAQITASDVGKDVVVGFEGGALERPIVLGILGVSPFSERSESAEITIRGERLAFEGKTEVVIRCGPTSITLTETGKILIKGEYVSSRASGTHRIRGGSVQIN